MSISQESILILHGWGSSLKHWTQVKNSLENQGYKVFVPDLPGFGESPPPSKPWEIDDYVEWVKRFCEKHSQLNGELIEPFFLIGHSFGGGVAVKFTAKYPKKVSGLVLISPAIVRQKKVKQYIYFVLSKIGKLIFSLPILSFLQPMVRKILYRFLGVADYYKLYIREELNMKETFKKVIREDLQKFLPQVKSRTLIIWGDKDKVTPLNDAYLINKGIPDSDLKIIPEIGHIPHFQVPEKLVEIILQFLRS